MAINEQAGKSDGIDPTTVNYIEVLDQLERYISGRGRIELVKAIKDTKVDVFGAPSATASWKTVLGKECDNVEIHDAVPYEEALDVMKQSKIVLNSSPKMKNGVHERILAGLACGALVITDENDYLGEHFTDGEDIAFYRHGKWDKLNESIQSYLSDEDKRKGVVEKGGENVMQNHTWDNRAEALLKELPPILDEIKKQVSKA